MFRVRKRAGVLFAALIGTVLAVSSCTATPAPSVSPTTQASPPLDKTPIDTKARLEIDPAEYDDGSVVTARFGTAMKGRPVALQRGTPTGWEDVDNGRQDARGQVVFRGERVGTDTLRAVAAAYSPKGGEEEPEIATPEANTARKWRDVLTSDFSGNSLDRGVWGYLGTGSYTSKGLNCAAPYPSNVAVAADQVHLSVTLERNRSNSRRARAAGCEKSSIYRNAMISTAGLFTSRTGLLAVRVKFPPGAGSHGLIKLQSVTGTQVHTIESYGYGGGLTNTVRIGGKRFPPLTRDAQVMQDVTKNISWWSDYHIFTVEWSRSEVIFRMDGEETLRVRKDIPDADYFVTIGMLSSDEDLKAQNAKNEELVSQTLSVDWVKVWTMSA